MLLGRKFKPEQYIDSFKSVDFSIDSMDSISDLLQLCQLTKKDLEALLKIDDIMEEHAAIIADRHYEMIMSISGIKDIFNQHTDYKTYTTIITAYFKQLTKPTINKEYIDYRKKIGQVHSRIHLTDEWYIGSYVRVYEYLLPYIISKFQSKPSELAEILIAFNRIITFDSLLVLRSYQEATDFQMAGNINKVTESVLGANKVHHLLNDVHETVNETSYINEAATSLSDSIQEVASHTTSVSSQTQTMITDSKTGLNLIQDSLHGFLKMTEDFKEMNDTLSHLLENVEEITKIMSLIENFAENTNLLALNASIEAARAGEYGKGFSVVASEVRRLAEQTKDSVQQINHTVESMQDDSVHVGQMTKEMAEVLNNRVKQATEAMEQMQQITKQLNTIGESTTNMADIIQEQSSSTGNITDRITNIYEQTEKIKDQSHITGKSIYDASVEISDLREKVMNEINSLSSTELLQSVRTEHHLLEWWLYNRFLGYDYPTIDQDIELSSCRLEHWLHEQKQAGTGENLKLKKVEKLHHTYHVQLKQMNEWMKKGNMSTAYEQLREVREISGELDRVLFGLV
ncbi:hypothetical protein FHP05_08580 [Cerasibacillus terrae]|uniref:Methyl-accepting transducer domain-containing protein n=1 Tax=Cerasibacillus terrae TaxID=2498845 RepID=A0A5C8NSM9_9BACI|nr:globin-coupled sensor protein [Cerasibacillus terrae]TXL64374.1 hypothetical protein FHP05_08580 [Cerasibacillus terrae]